MRQSSVRLYLCSVLAIASISVLVIQIMVMRTGARSDQPAAAVPDMRPLQSAISKMRDHQIQTSEDMADLKRVLIDVAFEIRRMRTRINPHCEGYAREASEKVVPEKADRFSRYKAWYRSIEETVRDSVEAFNLSRIWERLPPGSVLLDVGANIGAFTDYMADACPSCSVYAFEPMEEYADFIRHNYHRHKSVHVYPIGLGDANENATLWVSDSNLGWNTLLEDQTEGDMRPVRIQIATFDHWASATGVDGFAFAKIDVEGAEYRVLRGMMRSLEKMHPKPVLFIEIGWGRRHPHWKEELEVFEWLFDHGYQRIDLTRISSTVDVLLLPDGYPGLHPTEKS